VADASKTKEYYYLHEQVKLRYTVKTKNPPATSAEAIFHAGAPDGAEKFRSVLQTQGKNLDLAPWTPKSKGITLDDSPIFAEFNFKKDGGAPPEIKVLLGIPLAEAVPSEVTAMVEVAYPAEKTAAVKVEAWKARSHDLPGHVNDFKEKDTARIDGPVKTGVKWSLGGVEQAGKTGESVTLTITDAQLGKQLELEAYVGDLKGHARGIVVVPKLTLLQADKEPPDELYLGDHEWLARLEPGVKAAFTWTLPEKKEGLKFDKKKERLTIHLTDVTTAGEEVTISVVAKSEEKKEYKAEKKVKLYLGNSFVEFVLKDALGNVVGDVKYALRYPGGNPKPKEGTVPAADGKVREEKVPKGDYTLGLELLQKPTWGAASVIVDTAVVLRAEAGHKDDTAGTFEVVSAADTTKVLDTVKAKVKAGVMQAEWTPTEKKLGTATGPLLFVAKVGAVETTSGGAPLLSKRALEVTGDPGALTLGFASGFVAEATPTKGKAEVVAPYGDPLAWVSFAGAGGALVKVEADGETRELTVGR